MGESTTQHKEEGPSSFRPLLFLKAIKKNPLIKVDLFGVIDALMDELVTPIIRLDRRAFSNYGFLVLAQYQLLREWPSEKHRMEFLGRVGRDLRWLG